MTLDGPPDVQGAPLLSIRGLSVRFATPRGSLHAVDDVTLSLSERSTLGIVGESGSGKSVLMRAAIGLLPATATVSGSAVFEGETLTSLSERRLRAFWGKDIGMVFQNPMSSLNPVRTIAHHLGDPLRHHLGMSRAETRRRSIELLDMVRIPDAAAQLGRYPHELSGGMRQRVMIAGAIACHPRLLIADEPTTALDVTVQRRILDLLDELQREVGMAMILITHDLAVAAGRTDRLAVMYAGRLVEQGTTASLFERTSHPYTAALLDAVPALDRPSHTRLQAISGRPPDPTSARVGCSFAPRCPRAQERCRVDDPTLATVGPDQQVACFFPLDERETAEV